MKNVPPSLDLHNYLYMHLIKIEKMDTHRTINRGWILFWMETLVKMIAK